LTLYFEKDILCCKWISYGVNERFGEKLVHTVCKKKDGKYSQPAFII
jgi:hypothetical protein